MNGGWQNYYFENPDCRIRYLHVLKLLHSFPFRCPFREMQYICVEGNLRVVSVPVRSQKPTSSSLGTRSQWLSRDSPPCRTDHGSRDVSPLSSSLLSFFHSPSSPPPLSFPYSPKYVLLLFDLQGLCRKEGRDLNKFSGWRRLIDW